MDLKQTFVIKSFADVMRVHSFLGQHHSDAVGDNKPLVVKVDQKEETRTKAQNRLIHMWFGEIAKHTGDTPEQMKFLMKKKFFASIIVRDNEESKEQYDSVIQFKKVIEQMSEKEQNHYWVQYNNLVKMFVKDHLKTHKATTKQLSEFCDKIHDFASITLGLYLTCPDDLKWVIN
ncbi:recombination protein NinB [Acinetobacter rathckeae]|uniref:recombination protein NinB n=1 Tax=Acinetobacter rathckeae TaxID=2605272 RepID=UPI0018A24D9C|nr:recombination protein NinB [Acinetobacter rathckeae]MBF7687066.1 recombination protein NinB [Acinetobacter rathckeae]